MVSRTDLMRRIAVVIAIFVALVSILRFFTTAEASLLQSQDIFEVADEVCVCIQW